MLLLGFEIDKIGKPALTVTEMLREVVQFEGDKALNV
jgi:hypothetical protein